MAKNRQTHTFLRLLARSYGIATSYKNFRKRRVTIPPETLCPLISAVSGEHVDESSSESDFRRIYNKVREESLVRMLPLTLVAWDGKFPKFWAWLPEGVEGIACTIIPEHEGQHLAQTITVVPTRRRRSEGGQTYLRVLIDWEAPIPYGYYTFHVRTNTGGEGESLLISAPAELGATPRQWGAFAPAYALRSTDEQGIGGYKELLEAARVIKQNGGQFLGTLPLLPVGYESRPPETSPYSPISRLFWNELFLDLSQLPGPYEADIKSGAPGQGDVINYPACYAYKKSVLGAAAQAFFAAYPEGDEAFREYLAKNVYLNDYADFRARQDADGGYEDVKRLHLYAQYACHLQLSRIKEEVESGQAAALYLDYTVGVHRDGFDALRLSELFLKGYQVGAPPDKTFVQGQTWGFEPPHPRKLEESRFRYLRDCFHHYFQYSRIMRIDHVMGLYRLFCVPDGQDARGGTYVYYNLNAQLGVLCLEAWRHGATVVGEDLGVVPDRIREAMDAHKLNRMWIGQNDIGSNPKTSFRKIRPSMIASLNSHDMFPFAAYMQKFDLETLHGMGIMNNKFFTQFSKERDKKLAGLRQMENAYLGAVEGMARSKAQMVLINMEDLWEETIPQNMPGTTQEHPNWARKYAKAIPEWSSLPLFQETVNILNLHRMARP